MQEHIYSFYTWRTTTFQKSIWNEAKLWVMSEVLLLLCYVSVQICPSIFCGLRMIFGSLLPHSSSTSTTSTTAAHHHHHHAHHHLMLMVVWWWSIDHVLRKLGISSVSIIEKYRLFHVVGKICDSFPKNTQVRIYVFFVNLLIFTNLSR